MLALHSPFPTSDVSTTGHILTATAFAFPSTPRSDVLLQSFHPLKKESFNFLHSFASAHILFSVSFLEANLVEDPNEPTFKSSKFLVIGHRGCGMNILHSSDPRFKFMKENSIPSFNAATRFPVDFIEFDVQVRKCRTQTTYYYNLNVVFPLCL